jgi:hypothetical protein
MADTQTETNVENLQTLDREEMEKEAKKIKEARTLPIAPCGKGGVLTVKEWNKWAKLLTEESQWNRLAMYLYRIYPVINKKLLDTNAEANLELIPGYPGFDLQKHILGVWGGGKYRLIVNDVDVKRGNTIFEVVTEQYDIVEYPPKINLLELDTTNKMNAPYVNILISEGKLHPGTKQPIIDAGGTSQSGGNSQPSNNDAFIKEAFKMMQDTNKQYIQGLQAQIDKGDSADSVKSFVPLIMESMKQNNPTSTLKDVMQSIAPMINKPEPKQDNSNIELMKFYAEMQSRAEERSMQMMKMAEDRNTQLMTLFVPLLTARQEQKSDIDQLDKVMAIAERLGKKFHGGDEGEGEGGWLGLAKETLPQAIGLASQILAGKGFNAIPVNAQAQETQETPTTAVVQQNPMDVVKNIIISFKLQLATSIISGKEGWEFAISARDMIPLDQWQQIFSYMNHVGVGGVMAMMKQVPEFWNQVSASVPEGKVQEWIGSFLNYEEESRLAMDEGEED